MVRKLSYTILIVLIMVIVSACGNQKTSQSTGAQMPVPEEKPKIEVVKDGGVIKGSSAEITINKVSLSYDVLPDKTSGFYTHYPAEKGKVYIDIDVSVKNMQKQNIPCDKVMKVEATYKDGYKYKAMAIVKDSNSGFTYANIKEIKPLETRGMKFLVDCPEEVEKSKEPLALTFNLDGKDYQYVIR